jgi:hypothetical protein
VSSIRWIPVSIRLPDTRREVLAWGHPGQLGAPAREGIAPQFLGATRCNIRPDGVHRFDVELGPLSRWIFRLGMHPWNGDRPQVHYWAEITPPGHGNDD